MAKISPFCAVRPTRDKVGLVATRAYQFYDQEGRDHRMARNPFSFLHIINPGYKFHKEITGKQRFELVRNRYQEFKEDGIFIKENKPAFYIYKIVDRDQNTFHGIVASASVEDYKNDVIKKHEDTLQDRELLFKDYLETVGFNAEAVLLTYQDDSSIKAILQDVMSTRAEYEFTTTYRDTHYLWPVTDTQTITTLQEAFEQLGNLYIADGHHRSSSSALLSDAHPEHQETYHHFMSFLIPESELLIYEFNRLIKDLNGLSKEAFLIALDSHFRIENRGKLPYRPSKKHHFSMYLDGEYYSLYLRHKLRTFNTPLERLDTQILYETVLKPILGITDLRNDKRIEYIDGRRDIASLTDRVDSKEFVVSFGMLPITIEDLKEIADAGLKMPPKSTYIEPKLRSGVTIYEF
ncbi:DUF1015 domain-containing protein [Dokdonia donghaensis]|uniref:SpoOJ/ParA/ParB/repB family protein n=1 Tax=Dokdonia donghaensis DSW-1 TaxID=1300343 RepID=A0A0A2GSP2_9FLAO|nr:DUF1015 domain-containing protein [Dokdonia donghaensis]ANH61625.1 hypothetical protein I597_2734 [Dokdonia donghaensis DSW-1]KGO06222.1 hypothetical protein NV36_04810 [Dokdonia donghaensis DSW-1]